MPDSTVRIASSVDRGRGLRQHAKAFLQRWNENLGGGAPWQAPQAATLYEDLEVLCAMAERESASAIVEPALELAVYLCSFIDGDTPPNATQRQGLEQLVAQLAAALAGDAAPRIARGTAAGVVAPRQVFYLRHEARELAGLASRLGQCGYIVRPFETRQLLLLAFDEVSPDILIVDEAFIGEVHALTAAALRKRPAHRDPPLCIVLADATDHTRALFAQRAGADAVVTEHDPIALVAALEKLLAQRHARDFRVLIVEDDRSQAKFCDSILRHCGMTTCICEDAKRVTAMLNEFKPDLVLLDMYLPDANGIEIAQHIREQPRHAFLPIVFLTGEHDQNLRFDAIRIGADDFITKPVKPRHLVTAVESRIKRARELRAGQPEQRGERRGILSARDVMAREIQRAAGERDRYAAVACIAVDEVEKIANALGFVAAGTLPQQIASALALELSEERTLCAWGEMRFVALLQAENELTLRETFEDLRRKLDARLWLSDETPVRLRFSVGCVRVPAEIGRADDLLARARSLCIKAQQSGGAHCEFDLPRDGEQDEDPRRRLLRAVLRAPNLRGMGRLDFQPLLPLSGQITGQYEVRMDLVPEKFANALRLKRSDYLPLARELGLAAQADHQCVRALLDRVHEGHADKPSLRLHVPVCGETAFDSTFAPWLAAELRGRRASGGVLVLVLTAAEVHARLAQAQAALEPLQRLGLRLGVELQESDRELGHALLQVEAIHVVKFVRPAAGKAEEAWGRYSGLFNEARSLGKTVLASGVQRMEELAILMRLGVHYVQGDVLGAWSADWNFDFAVVA